VSRYAAAVLTVVIALLLRGLLEPLLGYSNPYHTVWLAVVVSTWYCGLGPAIVTTLLSLVGVWYWFLLPYKSLTLQDPTGGSSATIRLREEDHRILVAVQDEGRGIPPEKQLEISSSGRTGVGFRGMRERLRQLGGRLEVQSSERGSTVSATLPLTDYQTTREHISKVT
jgi:K+-sensing histidine kinase KdpD